jgi:hypothetical protein
MTLWHGFLVIEFTVSEYFCCIFPFIEGYEQIQKRDGTRGDIVLEIWARFACRRARLRVEAKKFIYYSGCSAQMSLLSRVEANG